MAFSKEYTYWHLTSEGWIAGKTRTDFSNYFEIAEPKNRVLTIKYEEIMSSAFSDLKSTEETIFEIDDKKIVNDLIRKFPQKLYICPPDSTK